MNTGFYTRAENLNKPTFEAKNIWKLQMEDKETPYYVAILSPYFLDLAVHYVAKSPQSICNKMYFEVGDPDAHCEECLKPGYRGVGLNRPSLVRVMIGYCFDLVGAKGKTTAGKDFNHDPVKLIQISSGKGKENFENLNLANVGEYLRFDPSERNIWKLKAKDAGGMYPPALVDKFELKSQPHLKTMEIPEGIFKKFTTMPKAEVEGIILSAFGNLNREFLTDLGVILPDSGEDFYSSKDSEEETDEDM